MDGRLMLRMLGALAVGVTLVATVACGSGGGSDEGTGAAQTSAPSPGSDVPAASDGSGAPGSGGGAAAASVPDVCELFDLAATGEAYGGEAELIPSATTATMPGSLPNSNCKAQVNGPVSIQLGEPPENITLSLRGVAAPEKEVTSRPTDAEDFGDEKSAWFQNDEFNRHIVWWSDGVYYEISFLPPLFGPDVDEDAGFDTMAELAPAIIGQT